MAEPIKKCKKCDKHINQITNISGYSYDVIFYNIPTIYKNVHKLEDGIHCLDCWKKVEKDYRWYANFDSIFASSYSIFKNSDEMLHFHSKTNSWNDPDVPISPNDKIPNYWVGCLKCDWERELNDDERDRIVKCEKCNGRVEIYPAGKRKNANSSKCSKCNFLIRENQECQSCLNVKKLFEDNDIKQSKLESDGGLSLQFETGGGLFWEKISASKLNSDGAGWKPIKDYLQRTNKTTLAYENGELILSNNKNDDNRERERERESKFDNEYRI
ncbi:MAG: hypothetical protein I3274_05870 [Candidatus Moeniiplasma glomeromycotorum]|nr:hypothetical protein [Candidatus Moeniiplasma glomeromycotorum]